MTTIPDLGQAHETILMWPYPPTTSGQRTNHQKQEHQHANYKTQREIPLIQQESTLITKCGKQKYMQKEDTALLIV